MKIGIVGGGVVGRATARAFIEYVDEVRIYDVLKERRTHDVYETRRCNIIFVCLPTPQKKDSLECDVSAVEQFFSESSGLGPESIGRNANYVLRSTVPIGATKRLAQQYNLTNLVHSPEFLTARCAVTDAQIPSRNIVGYAGEPKDNFNADQCGNTLVNLYSRRFPGVPTYLMSSDESEAVKLFQNSFFATKVSYWNECRTLADKLDLDWNSVMEAILADGRISPSHTQVPGPDGRRGFGGSCLPKDLASLEHQFMEAKLAHFVTTAARVRNLADRGE